MFTSNKWTLTPIWVMTVMFICVSALVSAAAESEHTPTYNIGRPASQAEIHAWNIDIAPNGEGLPSGQGTVIEGATVYTNICASCHGLTGIEGPMPILIGGRDTLTTNQPLKTVGSYWPYATTLYDYIYRAMPLNAPQSLSPQQVYAVVAWILFRNGIIEESTILNAQTLPAVHMPNQKGFVRDTRPDVSRMVP
ncbi:MAG: cytochrome c [Nitrospirales bacterium]|nr:MAG: cytochrome c [Nitrospirales bacterium]